MREDLREELRQYLKDNGVKQNWVAEQLGLSKQMIHMYLADKRNMSEQNERKLKKLIR